MAPKRDRARAVLLPAALAMALLLSGCKSTLLRGGAERRIERRLPELLGPAERYDVRIVGSYDDGLVRGRAKTIQITGRKVFARNEMMMESIWLELRGLRFKGPRPAFVSLADSEVEVELSDTALNRYFVDRGTRYEPRVTFERNSGTVEMNYRFLDQDVPVRAVGHLEVEDRTRIMFRADDVNLKLLDMEGFNERFVEDRVNPLVDVSSLALPLKLDSVRLEPGRAVIHGSATIGGEDELE